MSLKLGTTDISGVPTTLINTVNNKLDASTYTSNPRTNAVYITQTYHSGSSWYRVWSDGFIEQGGTGSGSSATINLQVTFLKNFTTSNYTLVTGFSDNSAWSSNSGNTTQNTAISWASATNRKSSGGFYFGRGYQFNQWYACGY